MPPRPSPRPRAPLAPREALRSRARRVFPLLAALAVSLAHGTARAESFAELAARARAPGRELAALAAPFFADCGALVGRSREVCEANLGRAAAEIDGVDLLVSMPGDHRVVVGPYEPRGGGFRVTVPGFEIVRPTGGVVGTQARRGGVMRPHVLAETFVRVPAAEARAWSARNAPQRLRVRFVVRFGAPYEDRGAPSPDERRAVVAEVRATQVYNASAGDVLVDSTEPRGAMPDAPTALDGRRSLWTARGAREVVWPVVGADPALFHARVDRSEGGPEAGTLVMLATVRAETIELARIAASADAQVDLVPHGERGALVIVTETRSARGRPGRGQVLLVRYDAERAHLVVRARWQGSNDEAPPAWVRDPQAPVPEPGAPDAT